MLDLRRVVDNTEEVIKALETRGGDFSFLNKVVELDKERKALILQVESLKSKRNEFSKKIGQYKRDKKDTTELMTEIDGVGDEIKVIDDKLRTIDEKISEILLGTPNVPRGTIPVGNDEDDNVEVKKWGDPRHFDFKTKAHWDLVTELDIIDFERAAKITGSRFAVYKRAGARLERALISFMLDLHTSEHGYDEILPPVIVNSKSMIGTGNLPKFGDDAFKLENSDYFLIPTAEVPVTNLHADEALEIDQLPIKYTAYSPCFRSEAGSAGRDTRGIIRQHQFNKVELVKFVKPEDSDEAHEQLLADAEKVLQLLELPYRVIELCTGDIGFSSAKTYDIEVWLPSYGEYKEISSCSNFEDFQARRANIKFRRSPKGKLEFVHTLNGSGLAIGRTVAAIIENYQNEDGSITVPEVLRSYMGGLEVIK
jgi:seryl-tRNA synthetase